MSAVFPFTLIAHDPDSPDFQQKQLSEMVDVVKELAAHRRALEEQLEITRYHASLEKLRQADQEEKEREAAEKEEADYWASRERERQQQFEEGRQQRKRKREARKKISATKPDGISNLAWTDLDRMAELAWTELPREPSETDEQWTRRLERLSNNVHRFWNQHAEPLLARLPRYIDGLPTALTVRPPRYRPHLPPPVTGLEACLQCAVKDMICSHTIYIDGLDLHAPCRRCQRNGDRCLVSHPAGGRDGPERKLKDKWQFADVAATWDASIEEDEEVKGGRRADQLSLVEALESQSLEWKSQVDVIGHTMQRVDQYRFALPMWRDHGESLYWWKFLKPVGFDEDLARCAALDDLAGEE